MKPIFGWRNDNLSKFVIMHRYDITAPTDPNELYLRRWYIFRCPWFGVMLHKILREDVDRDMHDHPWAFVSFVLRGGYSQERADDYFGEDKYNEKVEWFNRIPHNSFHRISWLYRVPTWTLVFTGPKRSSWGFLVDGEWVPYRDYIASGGRPTEVQKLRLVSPQPEQTAMTTSDQ